MVEESAKKRRQGRTEGTEKNDGKGKVYKKIKKGEMKLRN